jgi:UDPglucose 6-dehydrogenase
MITAGIIGNGFVGNATSQFENEKVDVLIYDITPEKCKPHGLQLQVLCDKSDIIFICVPTPMSSSGSCHLGIIEHVINNLIENGVDFNKKPIVIRSTVPVGTSNKYNCFFMPEFLTEANARLDFKNTECWIFGRKDNSKQEQNINFMRITREILNTNVISGNIENDTSFFVETKEAEAIKLFKNTFLAVKVGFCNEFFRFCEGNNVNYENVIKGVITDSRITESHTRVPGNNGKFGFGGTCFPKDIASLQYQMRNLNVLSPIVNSTIERNNTIDRVEQDWKSDEGRAFINN